MRQPRFVELTLTNGIRRVFVRAEAVVSVKEAKNRSEVMLVGYHAITVNEGYDAVLALCGWARQEQTDGEDS